MTELEKILVIANCKIIMPKFTYEQVKRQVPDPDKPGKTKTVLQNEPKLTGSVELSLLAEPDLILCREAILEEMRNMPIIQNIVAKRKAEEEAQMKAYEEMLKQQMEEQAVVQEGVPGPAFATTDLSEELQMNVRTDVPPAEKSMDAMLGDQELPPTQITSSTNLEELPTALPSTEQ